MAPRSTFSRTMILAAAILCMAACITDLSLIYWFGKQVSGYSHLTNTLSSLGISSSPVAGAVTVWSVILGVIFIFFGFGFREAFHQYGKPVNKAIWLMALYGLGECIASGIFRADKINGNLTDIAILHDLLGGIGVIAMLLFPLLMRKIFTAFSSPLFFRFSGIIFALGLISTLLFSFRLEYFAGSFLYTYCGLWQRIFLLNSYFYFFVIAFMMLHEVKSFHQIKNKTQ